MGRKAVELPNAAAQPLFATTHWSVVLAAANQGTPEASTALEQLCRTYWYPLYAYIRRRGYSPEEAQDLTQDFFMLFLRKNAFRLADPDRGRFRSFLLKSLQHFLADRWRWARRAKRGSRAAQYPVDIAAAEARYTADFAETATPEQLYEQHWAITVIDQALTALRGEYEQDGKAALFNELENYLWGQGVCGSYAELAERLGMKEGAVRVAACRLRERCRNRLREIVAQTVSDPEGIEAELRHLIVAVG